MKIQQIQMKLPQEVYKNKSGVEQIKNESNDIFFLEKLEWKEGILQHIRDAEYPIKGFTSPETMFFVNMAKKEIMEMAKILSLPIFWPSYLILFILPYKYKIKILNKIILSLNRNMTGMMSTFILKEKHRMPLTDEIDWFLFSFLTKLGVEHAQAEQFAENFSHLIEYDNAYRYRIQDIMSESSRELMLANPKKEIVRLIGILAERDDQVVARKFKIFAYALYIILFFKKFKSSFIETIKECEFGKFQLDDADEYWVAFRKDYLFQGKTQEEREKIQKDLGLYMPKPKKL